MQCSSGSRLGGGAAATAPLWLRHWYTDHMTLLLKSAATTWSQKLLKNIRCWTASASTLHTSALAQIRWLGLRVNSRTNKVRTTATPKYLSELVQTHAPPRALRSSNAPMLVAPRIHNELARRAFSVAAPSTWNSLLYLLTFDCAITFSLSNGTWKPTYSNSLSPPVLHQAPLYLRT